MKESWAKYFIKLADLVSSKSKDRSTKVGAVIVGPENEVRSTGFNGFPIGVNDDLDERHERPIKYDFVSHAERNAIYLAARNGVPLKGCTMIVNWEPYCLCSDCAKAIIQSGIKEVVGPNRPFTGKGSHWDDSLSVSRVMLKEAGVATTFIDCEEVENES